LERRHVDLVDVRPFLAVDLDADEIGIQYTGDVRVHEALSLHDVAPVARAVPDREKDGLVFGLGLGERLRAPRIPGDRVVRMKKQIRACLPCQPIRGWLLRRRRIIRALAVA
jgi:hypothetical protein